MKEPPGHASMTSKRWSALIQLSEAISTERQPTELFRRLAGLLTDVVDFDAVYVTLYDADREVMQLHLLETRMPRRVEVGVSVPVADTPGGVVVETQQPLLVDEVESETRFSSTMGIFTAHGLRSACLVPLSSPHRRLGVLGFASLKSKHYTPGDAEFVQLVAKQVAIALDNAFAYEQLNELRNKVEREKLYLEEEIRTEHNFREIVGESAAIRKVLNSIEMVAGFDSTVLILGETGTGKELVARALHDLSARREKTFVKLNCSAVPSTLVESELFGHERGAFTGAIAQRIGRFELADGGTLFLDEVGDVPLEVQPKLFRVLQERSFERLGSNKTLKSDVRLVAATNRNLEEMSANRQFRSDLYYRLNVFRIVLPPLRERREDIPLLVHHFVKKYSRRMKRQVESVPAAAMKAMTEWHWPGNIRELENFIERAVILSPHGRLEAPLAELREASGSIGGSPTLDGAARELILSTLRQTGWVIGGPAGAAVRLGLKRTSLQSKMRQLGIVKPKLQ
jgi:formate hydrogenlyase transcriptional activator